MLSSGINVYDVGLTVSPGAYFAQFFLDCKSVAMVTASHNKNGWTGFKMGIDRPLTLTSKLSNIFCVKKLVVVSCTCLAFGAFFADEFL